MLSFAKKIIDKFEDGYHSMNDENDSYFKGSLKLNNKGHGLRVLHVEPQSEAHKKGLESWFDFIVKINHHELPMKYPNPLGTQYSVAEDGTIHYGDPKMLRQAAMVNLELLREELVKIAGNEHSSKEVVLDVWNAKGGVTREVVLPLGELGQATSAEELKEEHMQVSFFSKSLGLTLESQHLISSTYVWRILHTHEHSPAFQAQLIPYSDYVIGCESAFEGDSDGKGMLGAGGESLLSHTISSYYNAHYSVSHQDVIPITLFVYNHDYDVLRPVTVNLSRSWSLGKNRGILGCDVGYGILHRIPEVIGKFEGNNIIDDVLFESKQRVAFEAPEHLGQSEQIALSSQRDNQASNSNVFVPISSAPPPPKTANHHARRHSNRGVKLEDLNDYMDEEISKSKELDHKALGPVESSSLPPPPPPTTSSNPS